MKYALSDFTLGIELAMREPSDGRRSKSVTVFCNPRNPKTERIRVCRRCFKQGPNSQSFVVTYGKPNYREREFMKLCKKAKCAPKKFWIQFAVAKKKKK